ncbi:TonB-dependent receptor [Maribellus maritimus]|uniref:TonB-dependent receptor n=1 Tax=Maribellus maritimus TaxID=2870838 RepID=UPI001EEB7CB1|nr:TonB-dependent receptor [Maribellus maritimus]MCG6191109.1 TonB-dependent receptor [Maribellus maritimus]
MKLTVLTFFLGLMSLSASIYSQSTRLSLDMKNVSIVEVFKQIESQTEFVFIYKNEAIDLQKKYDVVVNESNIEQILTEVFRDSGTKFEITDRQIIITKDRSQPQNTRIEINENQEIEQQTDREISGTIVDQDGLPLPGVSVVVKETTIGTVTDVDGKFRFSIPPDAETLVVSFVGLKTQEIQVAGRSTFSITMQEAMIGIEEVVAIGYGTMQKRSVSTAISSLKAEKIEEMPVGSVGETLYGQLSGLYIVHADGQPGSSPTLRIRGTGSLTASSDPLYVIDGYPTADASYFMNLSPNDIESIDVLKDAASAAIYGSRAGNGVILVTTKKGKTDTPEIKFGVAYGFQQPQRYIDVLSASEFALMVKDARENQGMAPLALLDNPSEWNETNWQKDVFFRTAGFQRYNFSVNGASPKSRYSISAEYQNQQGIVQNSFNHKIGIRGSIESDLNKIITVGVSIQPIYTYQRVQQTSGGNTSVTAGTIAEAVTFPPIYGPYVENGDYFQISQHAAGTDFNSELTNPLSKLLEIDNDYNTLRTLSQGFITVKPLEGLTVNSKINATTINQKHEYYRSAYSPGSSRTGNKSNPNLAAIDAYRAAIFSYNIYWSSTATYVKKITEDHEITALLGYDVAYDNGYSVRQDDRTDENYPIAYGNTNITNVNGAYIWNGSSSNTEYAFDAVFSRLNYNYKNKLLFSGSIRQDRSSKFGPANRAGIFWSFSTAYNLAEESWMENYEWLSIAKIRGSYGVTGNDQVGNNYVWTSTLLNDYYIFGESTNSLRVTGYYPGGYSNLGLGWEKNTQFDFGLDLGLFNRVALTVDFYNRISDAVLSASIPNLNGKSSTVTINAGEIRNRGIEFSATAPIINGEFKWTAGFNISFNRNKLLSLATGNDYYGSVNGMLRNYVGRPLGDIYTYVNIGTFNSAEEVANDAKLYTQSIGDLKFLDVNEDGTINSNDMVYQGNNMPKFNAGLTSQFSYKNFDFSFVLDGQYGGLIYWGFGYGAGLNRHMENAFSIYAKNRWRSETETGDGISQKAGSSNVYGALVSQQRYLFSSDYLKIRNLAFGYTIPKELANKIGLKNLRLNVNAQNLFSFDEYPGYSVEAAGMGGSTGGSDGGNYPSVRTFTFGVNIDF